MGQTVYSRSVRLTGSDLKSPSQVHGDVTWPFVSFSPFDLDRREGLVNVIYSSWWQHVPATL